MVRYKDDAHWNVAPYSALILTCFDKVGSSFPVEGESDKAVSGSLGPVETLGEATIDCEGLAVK